MQTRGVHLGFECTPVLWQRDAKKEVHHFGVSPKIHTPSICSYSLCIQVSAKKDIGKLEVVNLPMRLCHGQKS